MENTRTDRIEQKIKEIREKEQEVLELKNDLKKKELAFKVAQDRAITTLSALNDLQNSFDTKVEIQIIDFSTDYYEIRNSINMLKEEECKIVNEIKLLQKLKESCARVSCETLEQSSKNKARSMFTHDQINKLLAKQEIYRTLSTNLTSEAEQMKALILTELDEIKFLEKNPGLKKMSENIEITHKILADSISQVEKLKNEIESISSRIVALDKEISFLEIDIEKIVKDEED